MIAGEFSSHTVSLKFKPCSKWKNNPIPPNLWLLSAEGNGTLAFISNSNESAAVMSIYWPELQSAETEYPLFPGQKGNKYKTTVYLDSVKIMYIFMQK